MKWFDRWFMKMSKRAWEQSRQDENIIYTTTGAAPPPRPMVTKALDSRHSMNMKLMPATGGSILEIHWYDERKDHHENDLYIIDDNEDLAPQLASIIMQHKMRH